MSASGPFEHGRASDEIDDAPTTIALLDVCEDRAGRERSNVGRAQQRLRLSLRQLTRALHRRDSRRGDVVCHRQHPDSSPCGPEVDGHRE